MSDQNRFCLGNRTSCNSIKQYPLQSGCIRNVHYPLKSGNFVQDVEKNRTEPNNSDRFLVEVTGFEPATFWSRKMGGYPVVSVIELICRIIPDRKPAVCFSLRFAPNRRYGRNKEMPQYSHVWLFGSWIIGIPKSALAVQLNDFEARARRNTPTSRLSEGAFLAAARSGRWAGRK